MLMKTPRSMDLAITSRCNLRCEYCSHFTSAGDVNADLAKEEWLRFFEELGRLAVIDVCLCGGEPFCRGDLKELIAGIVDNRMRYSILTNGTLIDEDIADFIASSERCDYIQVSIDGSNPDVHDVCRGKGTFRRATEGIKRLQDHRLPVTVRATIQKNNVNNLEDIAMLLLEDMGLPSFSINTASYLGLCRENERNLALTIEERSASMSTLLRLDKKYKGRINANAGLLAEARIWRKMENARLQGETSFPGGGYLTGCGCPMSRMAVRADGVMVPCTQMAHIELGRINVDDLRDVWLHSPGLNGLRERRIKPLSDFVFCQGCDYINYCTGNCPALAFNFLGIVDHPSPEPCLKRFLESGGRIPALDEVI